jgi:hypothetical protein
MVIQMTTRALANTVMYARRRSRARFAHRMRVASAMPVAATKACAGLRSHVHQRAHAHLRSHATLRRSYTVPLVCRRRARALADLTVSRKHTQNISMLSEQGSLRELLRARLKKATRSKSSKW